MSDKQSIPIPFRMGLDTKTDPKQIQLGKFLSLRNSVFTETGLFKKRNGYGALSALPDSSSTYLTTFGGNLTAIGNKLEAYSSGNNSWVNKGTFQPISLSATPVVRSALNQIQCDSVIASNGLVCTAYTEKTGSTSTYKYVIQDSVTGQNIISPTAIPVTSGAVSGSPRVFLLGGYFVVVFTNTITATAHLQYIAISVNSPSTVTTNTDIAVYNASSTVSWDGVVVGQNLYLAYNTAAGGQQIAITYLSTSLVIPVAQSFAGSIATIMSVCADVSNASAPIIYASFYDSGGSTGYVVAVDQNLNKVMTATQIISSGSVANITATAQSGVVTVAYEVNNNYAYDSGAASNYLNKVAVTKPATVTTGTVGSTTTFVRSVGLASKGFLLSSSMYMLVAYDGKTTSVAAFQPTYFLVNLSGNVIAKLAYQNGGGYLILGLPQAQVIGSTVSIPYLFKDLIQSVNKAQGEANAVGIYSQTGVNLSFMTYGDDTLSTSELGLDLNLSGGFLYSYDGNTLNEQNFHLYPDMDTDVDGSGTSKALAVSHSGGNMTTQDYFYQVIYQWTDASGNIFNSAPSIPVPAKAASFSGSSNSVVVSIPTARLTYKSGIKLVVYRWSTAQQNYYQVTSISSPTLNVTTQDVVTFTDTQADSAILGNSLIYTTGGVIENTGSPACTALTIFDTRLWAIDAEDENVLGYSKQVIQGVPVEMSDLFQLYVAPNAGTNTSVGKLKCIFPMDDKLILFLHSQSSGEAMYYINGTGPDNTGANSQYSQPIFITSTVSCINQNSIVLSPMGVMFQAADDKGIWLLGRGLDTKYIGADVEEFNSYVVSSAVNVPGTTQIRFTLSNGVILMYDYYFNEWGTFYGASAISSTLYQNLHTLINSQGHIGQETPGVYLDFGNPVLMQFTTGWINLAGVQGYQRAYWYYYLGEYISPHFINVGIAFDYQPTPLQVLKITPSNGFNYFGGTSPFGGDNPFGGSIRNEQEKVHFKRQKCQAFQISMQEIYDPSVGVPAGAGFTLSGLNLVAKIKRGTRPIPAINTAG